MMEPRETLALDEVFGDGQTQCAGFRLAGATSRRDVLKLIARSRANTTATPKATACRKPMNR